MSAPDGPPPDEAPAERPGSWGSSLIQMLGLGTAVQAQGGLNGASVQRSASEGISGSGGALPFLNRIQTSFGGHDVSGVKAHKDNKASAAASEIGARAFATGDHVAFGGTPDLHTAAHEAAHVVQQQGGVQLKGGVGAAGDRYERHADAVADAVVAGESAEALLDPFSGSGGGGEAVQLVGDGKTGGKVSLGDFAKAEGVTAADTNKAGENVGKMNGMSLDEMKAHLGGPAKNLGPRSTKEMLGAISSGVLPRWVARVGAKAGFDNGTFGNPGANQIFATEPSDVIGLSAAQALVKVGWTPGQLGGQVGKEIGLCVLDTQALAAPPSAGSATAAAPSAEGPVREMNWKTLAEAAKDETANARFYNMLAKYSSEAAGVLSKSDLPAMFALAEKTPVGATPDGDEQTVAKYTVFRQALGSGMAASELFSGMGATISETGKLGAREVMLMNQGSGFKLTPENSVIHSLGILNQTDVDALMSA